MILPAVRPIRGLVFPAPTVIIEKQEKSSVTLIRKLKAFFSSAVQLANRMMRVAESYSKEAKSHELVGGFLDAAKSYHCAAEQMKEAYSFDSSPKLRKKLESLLYNAIINYTKRLQMFELSLKSQMELCIELAKCYSSLGMKEAAVQYSKQAYSLNQEIEGETIRSVSNIIPLVPKPISDTRVQAEICHGLSACYSNLGNRELSAKYNAKAEEADGWHSFELEPARKVA
ncbi:hypothetical protein HYT84_00570 [Candidatus Micrarchaeota archaeon]|nr:hypothetical protein [Candidatus Micrarchaeota archaeon]